LSDFRRSGAYPWALTGIFAAVHLVITLIPFSLSVSGTGAISFGMISASIVGYLLGPFFGTISVLIGSYLGIFINTEIALLGIATPIATAAGALAAGLLRVRKPIFIPIIYVAAMILYLISPIGLLVPELLWFHVIVFILSFLFLVPKISERIFDELEMKKTITARALFLFALVAVTLDQIVGSAIGTYYLVFVAGFDVSLVSTWYVAAVFIYPVERILGSIIIVFILKALVESLSTAYFDLPTIPFRTVGSNELSPQDVE
jgi:hypothetical protein